MASLDDKIASLEAEIEGYKLRLNDATSAEDIRMWAGLIKSCRDNLAELEKRKNTQPVSRFKLVTLCCMVFCNLIGLLAFVFLLL
jgi:hypothetical protein